jgi:hypothetical protein
MENDGHLWYARAGRRVRAYARRHKVSTEYVCGVLSVTSPRVQVTRNVRLARAFIETGKVDGMMKGTFTALVNFVVHNRIRGLKTGPFAKALEGDEEAVVLDTWMAKCFGVDQKLFGTKKGVRQYTEVMRELARMCGLTPAQTQAALWCGYIRSVGRTPADLVI